jgi:lauroyl/myristoyl acyltransferase
MWALHHAGAQGLRAHALVAAMEGAPFAGRTVLRRYVLARTRSVGRALGNAPLVVSGSLRPVIQALRRGEQVFAAIDVPADQVDASLPVTLCGLQARIPKGLLRLALDMQVPVTVYVTGFDVDSGARWLRITQVPVQGDVQELANAVFQHLQQALAQENAFWHFWGEAPRFFNC